MVDADDQYHTSHNNMLYYFMAADLIMRKKMHKLLHKFLSDSKCINNECTLIYSGSYGKNCLDKEYLYAVRLNADDIAIIYEDRYNFYKVFFIFMHNGTDLKLKTFGSKNHILYDPLNNKYKDEVYKKCASNYFNYCKPVTYEEYIIFFRYLFDNYWLQKFNFCGELNNLVFSYIGLYHI